MVMRADIQAEAEFIQRLFINQAKQEDAIMELAGAKPELGAPSLEVTNPEASDDEKRLEALMAVDPIIQFFSYAHLRGPLQDVSKLFCRLAIQITETLPRNPERTVALRNLLEAKDCAVRARLFKP
jgi:hypothetical protein